ncbi:MAG: ABC transporter permease [Planctomycetaceae bacterium]|nr:ABC transporter permease [Planctomycetaceae bacterium]
MFRFAPYVFKSLWRHRGRTLLTVTGSAVALFVFCFVTAVQQGLERLTKDKQAERTLITFQENRFCPASSKLPEDYARTVAKLPGVKGVVPIKVFTNNCRASLDVVVFHGLPTDQLQSARDLTLLTGSWTEYAAKTDGAIVGQAVANRRRLKVGQKFTLGEVTVSVVGTCRSAVPAEDNFIFTHLDFLQRARGKNSVGTVTQLEVQLADNADADALASQIDAAFHSGPVATTTRSKGVFQRDTLADLAELIGLAHWLGYACVGLVLALVATTTVMAVQDRLKEHAVLQTLGLRPLRIFRLVLAESMLQSATGGALGIGIGMILLAWGGFSVGAEGVTIAFQPSLDMLVTGGAVSLVVGVLAGIVPGWQAARAEIVTALRQA